jgi:hypothetical protein
MKLKRSYYCIVDGNNKPDYRFLFETPEDAKKQIKQIKNSTKGETLILGTNRRDFFSGKVERSFVGINKKINIKRGCWTKLKVKRINLIEDFRAERLFKQIIKAKTNVLDYTKQREDNPVYHNPGLKMPIITNPFSTFQWQNSFIKSRAFLASFAFLSMLTLTSVILIQKNSADKIAHDLIEQQKIAIEKTSQMQAKVLGTKDQKIAQTFDEELDKFVIEALRTFDTIKQDELEEEVRKMVAGSPMEQMVPYIAEKDRTVAAFLVGIAKKESNFGRRVPVLNGQDCYNYWGYRGIRDRMGTGGHTCFDSPKDAVDTVAGRLQDLVQSDIDTPQEMVIWKCGSSCAGHSEYSVNKWISDVEMYFEEIEKAS